MGSHAPHIDEMLQDVPDGERRTLAEAFMRRALPLLNRMVRQAPTEALQDALSSSTDVGSMARILTRVAGDADVQSLDPLAAAFARGAAIQQELLQEAGGAWTAAQVASHLGVSRQAVDKRRKRNSLLAVESAGGFLYPACQFIETGVQPGLAEVLAAISTTSGWTRLSVLLSETLIGPPGRTILDAIRAGDMDSALHAASSWGEQGAA
jgi:hypothetical protein